MKTSPLTGTPPEGGKQKMIARSAGVQLIDNRVPARNSEGALHSCSPEEIRDAVNLLYQTALSLLIEHASSLESQQQVLALARDQALARLRL